MKKARFCLGSGVLLWLAGCSVPVWTKAGATDPQREAAIGHCQHQVSLKNSLVYTGQPGHAWDVREPTQPSSKAKNFRECMQSLGWHYQKIDSNHSDHSIEEDDDEYPGVFNG